MIVEINSNLPTLILFSFTLLFLGVCLFFIGYLIGKNSNSNGVYTNVSNKPKSFFGEEKAQVKNNISIDDTKYVVDIKTTGMEKKYDSLGDTKTSEENISLSVNKLKNMKG